MDFKSKSQKKREAESLQDLGEWLVRLSVEQLNEINLPEELYTAVLFAKTIKSRSALRRQAQYIGTLMRRHDPAPIQEAQHNIEEGNYRKAAMFRETERWRDELVGGNEKLLEEILIKYAGADRQQLNQLVRNAVLEKKNNKTPGTSRALFRYLKSIREAPDNA